MKRFNAESKRNQRQTQKIIDPPGPNKVRNGLSGGGFKRTHGTKTGLYGLGPEGPKRTKWLKMDYK